MEYEIIERPELVAVYEFDYFYQDFRTLIGKVFEDMDETDTLLLNVSSGTPQMKSGLAVLQTMGEFTSRLIQITTPEKHINEHIHEGYDVEVLWELNEDNREGFENRCKEIQCPTLSVIKKEEIIKKHIAVYDYQAALTVARTIPKELTKPYFQMLKMAASRLLLDSKEVDNISEKIQFECTPVKGETERKYFEYALNLEIKLRKKEYADFIRGITPIVVDLFEIILRAEFGIDVKCYCSIKKGAYEWNSEKLKNTQVLKVLNQAYGSGKFKYGNVYSDHLRKLIQHYSKDKELTQIVDDLRNVEGKVRNLAAHQIVSITNGKIKQDTGFTGQQIMEKIKSAFSYAGMDMDSEDWDSYNRMNEQILKQLDSK